MDNNQTSAVQPQSVANVPQPAVTLPQNPVATVVNPNVATTSYAGFGIRFVAALIDWVISTVIMVIVLVPIAIGSSMVGIDLKTFSSPLGSLAFILYYLGFTATKGATPGKMIMGIKVTKVDGQPIGFGGAFLREILGKFVSSILLGLGYLWVIWDPKKQGFHDKIAGSVVIHTKKTG